MNGHPNDATAFEEVSGGTCLGCYEGIEKDILSVTAIPGSLLDMQNPSFSPDTLNSEMHCNQIPSDSYATV